jgi:putative RecB family exonuclease
MPLKPALRPVFLFVIDFRNKGFNISMNKAVEITMQSFSYSRIGTFKNCPRQYKFAYIEKPAVEKPVSVEAKLGSSVHFSLEKLYKYLVNGKILDKSVLLEDYMKRWEDQDRDRIKVVREYMDVDDYIKVGASALEKYYDRYHPFDGGEVLGLEKNISFPLDPPNRFTIRSKLDRIMRRADGTVEIIDYKTGGMLPSQQDIDRDVQMGLYQIGLQHLWPQYEKVELKQIWMRQQTELVTVMPAARLEEIRYAVYQDILAIENARRLDDFPPKESSLCDWCVYFDLCPAKRHRLALDRNDVEEFDAARGEKLAEDYLRINEQKKKLEAELKALREDILRYSEQTELTRLDSKIGHVRVSSSEAEGFPSMSEDENAFVRISVLARQAGLEECFKLDGNALYKEYFLKERLDAGMMEKLRQFLRSRRTDRITASYKGNE